MIIEGRHDLKTPTHIHVDVATKLIIGHSLKNKTYGEVYRAIKHVDEQQKLMGKKLECLTFDRESATVVIQDDVEAMSIKLRLKAAGQKIGLAEVSIRLIREKARANQFNVDLHMPRHHLSPHPNQEGRTSSYTSAATLSTA